MIAICLKVLFLTSMMFCDGHNARHSAISGWANCLKVLFLTAMTICNGQNARLSAISGWAHVLLSKNVCQHFINL